MGKSYATLRASDTGALKKKLLKRYAVVVGLRYNQLPIYKVDLPPTTILQ